jgi:hypothetical protein
MTEDPHSKLLPRNAAALRRFQDPAAAPRQIPGNPVMTRLESGIGNCFPGLECDLRNLERRFFPFLEIEIDFTVSQGVMQVGSADLSGMEKFRRPRRHHERGCRQLSYHRPGSGRRRELGGEQPRRRFRTVQAAIAQPRRFDGTELWGHTASAGAVGRRPHAGRGHSGDADAAAQPRAGHDHTYRAAGALS